MTEATPTKPRRADAQRNHARILEAAKLVFAEWGSGAQMETVAREAGVGVGTLYRHFPTKGDLLGELVAEQFTAFLENARAGLARPVEPWEAFAGTLRANAAVASSNVAVQNALTGSEVNWERVEEVRGQLLEVTAELIRRCKEAGVVRSDLDVMDIPAVMCGVCSTMSFGAADGIERDWRRHLELVLDGMRRR